MFFYFIYIYIFNIIYILAFGVSNVSQHRNARGFAFEVDWKRHCGTDARASRGNEEMMRQRAEFLHLWSPFYTVMDPIIIGRKRRRHSIHCAVEDSKQPSMQLCAVSCLPRLAS